MPAMSSGWPMRRSGVEAMICVACAARHGVVRRVGFDQARRHALMVMPFSPISWAKQAVSEWIAALVAP